MQDYQKYFTTMPMKRHSHFSFALWTIIGKHGYTGFYRGPWHKNSTTNLTNNDNLLICQVSSGIFEALMARIYWFSNFPRQVKIEEEN